MKSYTGRALFMDRHQSWRKRIAEEAIASCLATAKLIGSTVDGEALDTQVG